MGSLYSTESQLEALQTKYSDCTDCNLHRDRHQVVPGYGSSTSKLLILAEAPGHTEDRKGIPLVGKSGKLLDLALEHSGIERDSVWTTNTVLCIPKGVKGPRSVQAPTAPQIKACSERLHKEVYALDPVAVLALGTTAVKQLKGAANLRLGTAVGKVFRLEVTGRHISKVSYPAVATWHPAYLLRNNALRYENNQLVPAHKTGEEWLEHIQLAIHLSKLPRSF